MSHIATHPVVKLTARFMLRKLYSAVSGASCADNPDSPQHHEVLLPGYLYGMIIKERFDECLNSIKAQINQDIRQNKTRDFSSRTSLGSVGRRVLTSSPLFPDGPAEDELGHRAETGLLPGYRKFGLANRSRPATNVRLHHCC